MEFLIFTKYDKHILREIAFKSYVFNPSKLIINVSQIALAFILYFTGALDKFLEGYGIWLAVFFSAFVFLNYWVILGVNLIGVRRNAALGMEQTVRFKQDSIEVSSKTPSGEVCRSLEYSSISLVRSYSSFYHITTKEGGAMLVDKNGFTEGHVLDFERFLPMVIPQERIKIKTRKED